MKTQTASPPTCGLVNPDDILQRIRAAVHSDDDRLALHEPRFLGNEKHYVADCIDSTWVSYGGAYVERFERALAESCNVAHSIVVTSGTVALQVALIAAGLNPGDEVLVPSLTFVASANAIVHAGGTPHFIDVEETTLGVSPIALAVHLEQIGERHQEKLYNRVTGKRITGIVPVHVFGHPVDMDALREIAHYYGLFVVEDATEALGSRYKGRSCGSLAPISVLSFNGNKIVTTGGGGAILTNNRDTAKWLRHITTTAKQPHPWAFFHDEVAWNFRLPNINAAIGLAQLERLTPMLEAKRELHRRYRESFTDLRGLRVFTDAPFAESNYWLVSLILDPGQEGQLEPIMAATNSARVATRPIWTPMHMLPIYCNNPRASLQTTESLAQRIISLPSSPFLIGR